VPVIPSVLIVLAVGGYFLYRRADVRLVLMLSAAFMFLVRATQPDVGGAVERVNAFAQVFTEFAKGMTSPSWVLPICSAMGFAYVCKLTDCDAHLVNLLCRPLKHVKWLLIPGGITVAFFVNVAIISQTSTAAVVGPVLIPLVVASGFSRQTAGAMLLLGSSMGGELLNPAAVEVTAIGKVTGLDNVTIIKQLLPYNLLACGTAMLVFWAMSYFHERRGVKEETSTTTGQMGDMVAGMATVAPIERINPIKALVPLVPVMLLIVVRPWLKRHGVMTDFTEQTAIGGAMLVGVVCAACTTPGRISKLAGSFFEGAGFAFAHIVSMIVAAVMFAESIKVNGLIDRMAHSVDNAPTLVMVASIVLPWLLATVTGTAVGSVPLLIGVLVPVAMKTVDPSLAIAHGVRVGSMNAIVAQWGRTNSPVAPIANFCSTLVQSRPEPVIKRILIPFVAGAIALFIAAMLRIW
jgi:DcuC family C4-dicarboxylate transporter